jgi:hypothetical protein
MQVQKARRNGAALLLAGPRQLGWKLKEDGKAVNLGFLLDPDSWDVKSLRRMVRLLISASCWAAPAPRDCYKPG